MTIEIALPSDVIAMVFIMAICQVVTALGVAGMSVTYLATRLKNW